MAAEFDLPSGQYFSLSGEITTATGGQTRALLLRNRLFATRAGQAPIILTFDRKGDYPSIRAELRERGDLVDPMQLVNIYEWYRDNPIDDLPVLDAAGPPPIGGHITVESPHRDGGPGTISWQHPRYGHEAVVDYLRPDGSVYLREPGKDASPNAPTTDVLLVNSNNQTVGRFAEPDAWRQNWIRALTPEGQRAFIIGDSRFAINYVLPMPGDDMFVLYVMHNSHNSGDWNAPIYKSFTRLLGKLEAMDGLVTLTERQGEDVAMRYGARTNMFSVGNPVELPEAPDPLPARERARFVMICRLEPQKAIDDAVRMFQLVLAEEPEATLEIYGDGRMHNNLAALIAELGLEKSVLLKGYDPDARSLLWTATGFVVTSKFEGFPLATLESLSYGCPIVAYDVKYGIREQIIDDVNGFVLPATDAQAMADKLVSMVRDPALVRRLAAGALDSAHDHDHRAFLRNWKRVLEAAVEQKPRRTSLDSVKLTVREFGPSDTLSPLFVNAERALRRVDRLDLPGRVGAAVSRQAKRADAARRGHGAARSSSFDDAPNLFFAGTLTVQGRSDKASLDDAVITLKAVAHNSTAVVSVPLSVRRRGKDSFDLSAEVDMATVFEQLGGGPTTARLRLRLVWENSSWEAWVKRPTAGRAPYELSFERNGEAVLWRRPASS